MLETTKRRPRHRRRPSGKRIQITPRDVKILQLHRRYRYMRSTTVHRFLGGNETKLKARLTDLYHETGFLDRPPEQWRAYLSHCADAVTHLSAKGESFLRTGDAASPPRADLSLRARNGPNRQFEHGLAVSDALAAIDLGASAAPGFRFVSWERLQERASGAIRSRPHPFELPIEIEHRFKTGKVQRAKTAVAPDGVFSLAREQADAPTSARCFFLEVERANRVNSSNLAQTSFLKKVLAYRALNRSKTLLESHGVPGFLVLVVAPTRARIETMRQLILDLTEGRGSFMFLFAAIPSLSLTGERPSAFPDLFAQPWARAGYSDVTLMELFG